MRGWALACMLTVVLAGCGDPGDGESSSSSPSSSTTSSRPPLGGNGTGAPEAPLTATLVANRTVAVAPANITFTIAASGNGTWTLAFGDGAMHNGTTLPATVAHVYTAPGNVTAVVEVRASGGRVANDTVLLSIQSTQAAMPPQTVFEFGEVGGCASDANALSGGVVPPNCVSFHAGPDAPAAVDGHWLELTPAYWGLTITVVSDTESGDSDCFFLADDHATIVGDGHNGGEECMGVVPAGTAYVFLYPWGTPATTMTVTFTR